MCTSHIHKLKERGRGKKEREVVLHRRVIAERERHSGLFSLLLCIRHYNFIMKFKIKNDGTLIKRADAKTTRSYFLGSTSISIIM